MKTRLLILLLVLSLSGCCSVCRYRYKHTLPLEHTLWHLVKLGGEDVLLPEETFNVVFADGMVNATGACNRFGGRYSIGEKTALSVELGSSTLGACARNEELEEDFKKVLSSATHYDVDYDMLMIMSDGAIKAVFKAVPR